MKTTFFFIILSAGWLMFGCTKKEYTNEYNYYQTIVQDSTDSVLIISSPKDSSLVYDTVPVLYSLKKKLNVIRTECYTDFSLSGAFDKLPSSIYFYANTFEMGSAHTYYLRIITKDGKMYNSNIITLIISKLSRPVISVVFLTKSSLKLTWPDNSNDEQGYHVYRQVGSNDSALIGSLPVNSSSFTDNTIDTTKTYTYRVEVYSAREKLISDPLKVGYILDKYVQFRSFSVDEAVDGEIALTPDARKAVVTNYFNDNFTVLDLTTGSKNSLTHPGGSLGLAMSYSGNFFVTGGTHESPEVAKVWNMNALSWTRDITPSYSECFALRINKTDDHLVVGGEPVIIYNIADGTLIKNFNTGTSFTRSVVYSADESLILSGGNDNLVKLWNTSTGEVVTTFTGHTGHVGSVCFNADESQVISGSYEDGTVKIWDKNSGQLLKSVDLNAGIVSIHSRDDGDMIVATSNGTIFVLAPDGQTVQEFGDSSRLLFMDYNATLDLVAAYENYTVDLYKKIGHWEKL
jgi:WD40 repeat protein